MAQPVLAACGLHGMDSLPPLTLLKQDSGVDGSFLIASILGHRLRSSRQNHVLLVATQHTYHHYSSACMKLGFMLGPARDSGQLQILDVAAELFRNYSTCSSPNLDDIIRQIRSFVDEHPNATIMMDDLSYFLNFGYSESELIDFVEQLVTDSASFVLKVNTADLYGTFCANLDDLAQTEIRLARLASGQFKEVDGRLTVSRFQSGKEAKQQLMEVKKEEKSVLYKVNERNIKVFVPGEVGIKHL